MFLLVESFFIKDNFSRKKSSSPRYQYALFLMLTVPDPLLWFFLELFQALICFYLEVCSVVLFFKQFSLNLALSHEFNHHFLLQIAKPKLNAFHSRKDSLLLLLEEIEEAFLNLLKAVKLCLYQVEWLCVAKASSCQCEATEAKNQWCY